MGVARLYKVGSPYAGAELSEIDFEQTADVMYLAHLDHVFGKLTRSAHTNWKFADVTFGPTITTPTGCAAVATNPNQDASNNGNAYAPITQRYVVTAVDDETGQESRASGSSSVVNDLTLKRNYNTITWNGVTGAERYKVYKAENQSEYGYIGTSTTTTFTDNNIGPAYDEGPPEGQNPFVGTGNYPSTVTLFEQRLMLARTRNQPNGVWGSKSGDFENMDTSRPLRDDDALAIGVVSGRVNSINQLVSINSLLALSSDAIIKIDGATSDGYLTATQTRARRQVARGASRMPPLVADNAIFYLPNAGASVRSISYSFQQDGYEATDVSIFSPHLFRGFGIISWAYLQEPDSIIVAVRSDGKLLCFTFEQEQQVWGWTIWETDGVAVSVCAITENGEDRLYATIWRTVAGVQRLYIERLASSRWAAPADACYLDCAVSYALDAPTSTFRGLEHLEGRTVTALVDGGRIEGLTVVNGTVALPPSAGTAMKATIGLPYTVAIETLPLLVQGQQPAGRKQQAGQVVLKLIDGADIMAGPSGGQQYEVKARLAEPYGEPDDLLQGDAVFDTASHVAEQVSVIITQTSPRPLTLSAVFIDPIIGG